MRRTKKIEISIYLIFAFFSILLNSHRISESKFFVEENYYSEKDSLALIDFYNSTTINWDLTTPYRTWPYLTVDSLNRVQKFEIINEVECPSDNLNCKERIKVRGKIPSSFFKNLTSMKEIKISEILSLNVVIPPEIQNMKELTHLTVIDNLSGSIPIEIGALTNLEVLSLHDNSGFTGSIPNSIGKLKQLKELNLFYNDLVGNIPPEIGNLLNLETLDLCSNYLEGEIPSEIGNLSNLRTFRLFYNEVGGNIPPEIGNLSNLEILDLSYNPITGALPTEIGNLSNLTLLNLDYNSLEGALPAEIGNLSNLNYCYLFRNDLSGPIPPEIKGLSNLMELDLGANFFCESIPPEIGMLENLTFLNLGGNYLSNEIPTELWELNNLTALGLAYNELIGNISPKLGELIKLEMLSLSNNGFSGEIPNEIGNLRNLTFLDLSTNNLTGPIPDEIKNLTNLEKLNLNNNILTGSIPDVFEQFHNLEEVKFNDNQFSGSVPKSLNTNIHLDIQNNELNSLPFLNNLNSLEVQNNRLTFDDIIPNLIVIPFSSRYSPQKPFSTDTTIIFTPCVAPIIDLQIDNSITNNEYTWYKDGISIFKGNQNKLNLRNVFPNFEQYAGIYSVRVKNPEVSSLTLSSGQITIELQTPPPNTIDRNDRLCFGNSIEIAGMLYDCTNPTDLVSIVDTITGCITMYNIQLNCTDCREIDGIPTGITPNGDGVNESFIIPQLFEQPILFPNNELSIYDARGQLQYQQRDYRNDWSGQANSGIDLPIGTYFYVFKYDGGIPLSGKVTIIR